MIGDMDKDQIVLMNMCGRGDKDFGAVLPILEERGQLWIAAAFEKAKAEGRAAQGFLLLPVTLILKPRWDFDGLARSRR